MPGSYDTFDIRVEMLQTRFALEKREDGAEIVRDLSDVQRAFNNYLSQADKFVKKHRYNKVLRECSNPLLLFWLGIT